MLISKQLRSLQSKQRTLNAVPSGCQHLLIEGVSFGRSAVERDAKESYDSQEDNAEVAIAWWRVLLHLLHPNCQGHRREVRNPLDLIVGA